MANKCGTCGKFTSVSSDGVKCGSCGLIFHRVCANIAADARATARWQCKSCKKATAQPKNITPQSFPSAGTDTDSSNTPSDGPTSCADVNVADELKLIRTQLATIVTEMSTCRQEMSSFRQEVVKLNSTVADFNNRLNLVEEKVNHISKRLTDAESKLVVTGGTDFDSKIELHLNDRDQESFLSDLEITGVEELANENSVHLVTLIAQKVGVDLEERDIVSAERRGKRNNTGSPSAAPRPRTLVVRLARRALRDQLIRAARTRRGMDTAGILTTAQPRRFYINERLTWHNRRVFYRAREEARRKDWRYVWTRDGRIYARRNQDSTAHRIRSDSDIDKIFSNK